MKLNGGLSRLNPSDDDAVQWPAVWKVSCIWKESELAVAASAVLVFLVCA